MAQPQGTRARSNDDDELWFSVSASARRERGQTQLASQTAYQDTSARLRAHRSASARNFEPIPSISTSINKPLPPSPVSEKRRSKPLSLRSLVRRRPSEYLDPSHLQPEPYQRQRSSSANTHLSPDIYPYHYQQTSSHSMPNSPSEFAYSSYQPSAMARASSAAANYAEATQFHSYAQEQPYRSQHTPSQEPNFTSQPPRTRRTFPETSSPVSPLPERQRPRTWLSPKETTEPFHDASEFHLFVEATSGLPPGSLDFSTFSPTSPPRLQGSLFARGRRHDSIPLPRQASDTTPYQPPPRSSGERPGYDYLPSEPTLSPLVSSSALPRPDPMERSHSVHPLNLELERLGLEDEVEPDDDELPDYAQSQAEMNARRRREAAERARELEARWTSSRPERRRQ